MIDEVTHAALSELDLQLQTLLPAEYHASYEVVEPVSMGSAGLKYDAEGRVAWDQIWGSFCDLAMAGGPPHKGTLLEPGTRAAVDDEFGRYDAVAEEICRGVGLVTGLRAYASPTPGWVRVTGRGDAMTGWLLRAIVMENVAARREGSILELPAAPHFRVEKEIKNVVTVLAKTCHYWVGHIPRVQQQAIAELFVRLAQASPLIEPDPSLSPETINPPDLVAAITGRIERETGLRATDHHYAGWIGVATPSVRWAVWMMRALVASNVLSRREGTALFVPVHPARDPDGRIVSSAVARVHQLACARLASSGAPSS